MNPMIPATTDTTEDSTVKNRLTELAAQLAKEMLKASIPQIILLSSDGEKCAVVVFPSLS